MKVNCRSGGISRFLNILLSAALIAGGASSLCAAPLPGGTLDPLTIPKYVQPLVIPPQMPAATVQPGTPAADYNIAMRQFQQQILPGGQWNVVTGRADAFPATTLWSYGPAENALPTNFVAPVPLDPASPLALPGQGLSFNYPAFTVENQTFAPTTVRWINDLIDHSTGTYLPHLFAIDQTLHWANPAQTGCTTGLPNRTDCETHNPLPYTGPVPMVTHLHGAHVQPHSDGYPEAWWLPGDPGTNGIPATYAARGSVFTQADPANAVPGSAFYGYENSQPATTLWYHDHVIGMTRLNVYAGPAGFWLIRGGVNGDANVVNSAGGTAVLPGPAPAVNPTPGLVNDPNFDSAYRNTIREIPVVIQDRSFNADGSLFYPSDRIFFDGFNGPYIGNSQDGLVDYVLNVGPTDPNTGRPLGNSDISGIWNPEAFFNTIVVNGTTWPKFDVSDARYRLRLLNGCNSRTLNLALFTVVDNGLDGVLGTADDTLGAEVPFYQIGGDQGFLPQVVRTLTGFTTPLPGNGTIPADVAAFAPDKALLLMSAERADVIVDFTGLASGTRIRMINTAPDAPFGGFGDVPADLDTSGQVMDFVVNIGLHTPADDATTPVQNLILPAEANLGAETNTRPLTLNELVSDQVCVNIDSVTGAIITLFSRPAGDVAFAADCLNTPPLNVGDTVDFAGPRQAKLGLLISDGLGNFVPVPKGWADPVTEMPSLGSTEVWEFYNATVDAHPIHMHLVAYQIVNRQDLDPLTLLPVPGSITLPEPNERGFKDTVVAYPGQITRVKAHFDIAGLYVWHCHIVEHEDNEMMRPFTVVAPAAAAPTNLWVRTATSTATNPVVWYASPTPGVDYELDEATDAAFTTNVRNVYTGPGIAHPTIAGAFLQNVTVAANGTYYYRVRAVATGFTPSAYNFSQPSVVSGLTVEAPAGNVWVRTATSVATNPVVWYASATLGVDYEVDEATDAAFTANVRNVYTGPGVPHPTVAGAFLQNVTIAANGTYYYRVRAVATGLPPSAYKFSLPSVVSGLTVEAPAGNVWVRTATSVATNPVVWYASATLGVDYEVDEATDAAFTANVRNVYTGPGIPHPTIAGAFLQNVTIAANGTYYYRVRAVATGFAPSAYKFSLPSVVSGLTVEAPAGNLWVRTATSIATNPVVWYASVTPGVDYELDEATDAAFTANVRNVYTGPGIAHPTIAGAFIQNVTVAGTGTYYYRVRAVKIGLLPSAYKNSLASVVTLP